MRWLGLSLFITAGVTALLWSFLGPRALFAFLFLPFLPIGFGRAHQDASTRGVCPECGRAAASPDDVYCPRDGARLSQR